MQKDSVGICVVYVNVRSRACSVWCMEMELDVHDSCAFVRACLQSGGFGFRVLDGALAANRNRKFLPLIDTGSSHASGVRIPPVPTGF